MSHPCANGGEWARRHEPEILRLLAARDVVRASGSQIVPIGISTDIFAGNRSGRRYRISASFSDEFRIAKPSA
jgi:hypothetical protein